MHTLTLKKRRKLWAHQQTALEYATRVKRPALFMEMRLGKTVVVIRRCLQYVPLNPVHGLRVLIACPSSAFDGWRDDLAAEGQASEVNWLLGDRKTRLARLSGLRTWNIINKEGFLALPEIENVDWDVVVVDESTFIKNPKAKVTKFFLRAFRDVPYRWILTGLPNPENDLEFWPQLAFLDGHFCRTRTFWDFRARYYEPSWSGYDWAPKPGTSTMVQREVGRRCLVMRRKDVGMERRKIIEKRTLQFPDKIRKLYNSVEEEYSLGGKKSTKWATTRYLWLRQLCGGFVDKELVWEGKFDALVELLKGELAKIPVVVWFNFNAELFHAEKRLRKAGVSCITVWGDLSHEERTRRRLLFQRGQIRVILVQQAVAQMGMNLSHSDTAIYYSEPAGQLASRQTADRILTLAKDGALLIVYLMVEDSVDVDVHTVGSSKKLRSGMSLTKALNYAMEARRNGRP